MKQKTSRGEENIVYDVVVVGGGPAGMMAAARAGARGQRVLLLEKNEVRPQSRVGRESCLRRLLYPWSGLPARTGKDFPIGFPKGIEMIAPTSAIFFQ